MPGCPAQALLGRGFYLVPRLGKLNELVTVAKSPNHNQSQCDIGYYTKCIDTVLPNPENDRLFIAFHCVRD